MDLLLLAVTLSGCYNTTLPELQWMIPCATRWYQWRTVRYCSSLFQPLYSNSFFFFRGMRGWGHERLGTERFTGTLITIHKLNSDARWNLHDAQNAHKKDRHSEASRAVAWEFHPERNVFLISTVGFDCNYVQPFTSICFEVFSKFTPLPSVEDLLPTVTASQVCNR